MKQKSTFMQISKVGFPTRTSSAVSPVTEASVANNGRPVDFPDFTKGKWKERTPIFMDI